MAPENTSKTRTNYVLNTYVSHKQRVYVIEYGQTESCIAFLPCQDNEKVEAVPGVSQVSASAVDTHGNHLHWHLQCEEYKYEVIEHLKRTNYYRLTFVGTVN